MVQSRSRRRFLSSTSPHVKKATKKTFSRSNHLLNERFSGWRSLISREMVRQVAKIASHLIGVDQRVKRRPSKKNQPTYIRIAAKSEKRICFANPQQRSCGRM